MIAGLVVVAVLAQDPIETEAKFRAILERAEKAGLVVPDLPEAAAELETLSRAAKLPKELVERCTVVRAQATVLSTLHARLLKHKGGMLEIPLPPGRPVSVKIVELIKRGVKIDRQGIGQDIAYSELDPEWVLSTSREAISALPDATLLSALWLAKAARWEAAFVALGELETDHPLAAEARKRGVEAAAVSLEGLVKGRKWSELLPRLDALEKIAANDARLVSIRSKTLDAMVEHGKELCRKGSKGPMNGIIDLITRHFPDGADRIGDIREANRWIKVTDPKMFGIESVKGPPWTLESKQEDSAATAWLKESSTAYVGIAAVVKIPKGEKTMAGLGWDEGQFIVAISAGEGVVAIYSGNKGEMLTNIHQRKVDVEGRHHLSVRHRDGSFVVQYNGEELWRGEGKAGALKVMALNANKGKAAFDEIQLLKKE